MFLKCTEFTHHYVGRGGIRDFLNDLPMEVSDERRLNDEVASHVRAPGTKYRVAGAARPLLRMLTIRRLLVEPLFPIVCLLFGALFVAMSERHRLATA